VVGRVGSVSLVECCEEEIIDNKDSRLQKAAVSFYYSTFNL